MLKISITTKLYLLFRQKMLYKINNFALSPDDHIANQRGGISDTDFQNIVIDIINKLNLLDKSNDSLLEIGCGSGMFINKITPKVKMYVGFDIVYNLLVRTQYNTFEKNAFLINGDTLYLPFKDRSFDKILIYNVILYLPRKVLIKTLDEISRILKPDGYILIGDIPDKNKAKIYLKGYCQHSLNDEEISLFSLYKFILKKYIQKILNMPGGGWYTPEELLRIIDKSHLNGYILEQPRMLPFSHYRYDCIVRHKDNKA